MSKDLYIYSTLSNDNNYGTDSGKVLIAGKANVTNQNFLTPRGAVTKVTAEQLSALERHPIFQLHKKNGHITVESTKVDPEKVAADMTGRDLSAPDTAESLEAEGAAVPVDEKTTKKGK